MAVTESGLMQFLEEELAIASSDVAPDTLLFSTGLVDSFSMVSLLSFLEMEGGFRIDPSDVDLDNFDSVERILTYTSKKSA